MGAVDVWTQQPTERFMREPWLEAPTVFRPASMA